MGRSDTLVLRLINQAHQQNRIAEIQSLLANALQKEGWHVKQAPPSGEGGAGIVARSKSRNGSRLAD
jgi:hypothetical protein